MTPIRQTHRKNHLLFLARTAQNAASSLYFRVTDWRWLVVVRIGVNQRLRVSQRNGSSEALPFQPINEPPTKGHPNESEDRPPVLSVVGQQLLERDDPRFLDHIIDFRMIGRIAHSATPDSLRCDRPNERDEGSAQRLAFAHREAFPSGQLPGDSGDWITDPLLVVPSHGPPQVRPAQVPSMFHGI